MNTEIASKAISALYKHLDNLRAKRSKTTTIAGEQSKSLLFDEDEYISLIVGVKKVTGEKSLKPKKIPVPHPIFSAQGQYCIFVKDSQNEWKEKFQALGIKFHKVVGLDKLRNNYKTFDDKRKLAQSFDMFFTDDRILPLLSKLLGKSFFQRKKQPISVNLSKTDLKKEIYSAIKSTPYFRTGGSCIAVKVAPTSFTEKETHENLQAIIDYVIASFPNGWKNVQSLNIKTSSSFALPLYSSLPTGKTTISKTTNIKKTIKKSSNKPDIKPDIKLDSKKSIKTKKNEKVEKKKEISVGVKKPEMKKNPAKIVSAKEKKPTKK